MNRRLTARSRNFDVIVKVSAPFVAVGIDVPGESYFGGVAAASNVQNIFGCLDKALCEKKARGQFGVVTGSPHCYRKIAFARANLKRLFDREQILLIEGAGRPLKRRTGTVRMLRAALNMQLQRFRRYNLLSSDLTRKHRTLDRNHQ